MKLKDDFFVITKSFQNGNSWEGEIRLNENHMVYLAHFPGHPVTPGVVQLQIIHELTEFIFDTKIKLETLTQAKFLKIINPENSPILEIKIKLDISGDKWRVTAMASDKKEICFKLSAIYKN